MEVDAEMQAEFASLGVKVPISTSGDDVTQVWTINRDALFVFLGLSTQWAMLLVGNRVFRTGLIYASIEPVMRLHKVRDRAGVFADLQVMESAALAAFAEVAA